MQPTSLEKRGLELLLETLGVPVFVYGYMYIQEKEVLYSEALALKKTDSATLLGLSLIHPLSSLERAITVSGLFDPRGQRLPLVNFIPSFIFRRGSSVAI